jgi:hypothetical protein
MHRTAENETPRRYVPQDQSSAVVRATHYTPKIKMQNVTSSSLSTSQKRKEINRRRERNMCTWNVHDELVVTSLSLASGSATVISSRSRGSMSPFFCFAVGFFTYVLLFVLLLFF